MPKLTTSQEIIDIERELKYIFKQNVISNADVRRANNILHKWKILTEWKEDPTPVFDVTLFDFQLYRQQL